MSVVNLLGRVAPDTTHQKIRTGTYWITQRGTSMTMICYRSVTGTDVVAVVVATVACREEWCRSEKASPSGTPTLGPAAPSRDLSCYPVQRPGSG